MQIVINIDDNLYTRLFNNGEIDAMDMLIACSAIRKGIPLPKDNASNGDMVQAMFPNQKVSVFADRYGHKMISVKFTETEWNAPMIIKPDKI